MPNVLVTKSEQSIEALVKEYLAVTGMADLQGKERPFTEVARDVAALSAIDKKVFEAIYTATAFSGSNKDFLGMQEIASKVLADSVRESNDANK